jgi:hypothetical protein
MMILNLFRLAHSVILKFLKLNLNVHNAKITYLSALHQVNIWLFLNGAVALLVKCVEFIQK